MRVPHIEIVSNHTTLGIEMSNTPTTIVALVLTAFSLTMPTVVSSRDNWIRVGKSDINAGVYYVLEGSVEKFGSDKVALVVLLQHSVMQTGITRFDSRGKSYIDTSKPFKSSTTKEVFDCINRQTVTLERRFYTSDYPSASSLTEVDVRQNPRWFKIIIEKSLFAHVCSSQGYSDQTRR